MDLWGEIREIMGLLDLALREAKERGEKAALSKAAYYTAKAQGEFSMRQDGLPVTLIHDVIKGAPEVNEAMLAHEKALVEYDNARDAVQVYKLKLRVLEAQYEREWGQAGRGTV